MNYLPKPTEQVSLVRKTFDSFGGYDHRLSGDGGTIYNMKNLSNNKAPLVSLRTPRYDCGADLSNCVGFCASDKLMWVRRENSGAYGFYYNGRKKGELSGNGRRQIAVIGNYAVIFPDKVCYDILLDDGIKPLEAECTVILQKGEGEPEQLVYSDRICYNIGNTAGLSVGDGVTVQYGLKEFRTVIVGIEDGVIHFESGSLEADSIEVKAVISREVPDLEYIFECGNRLWGCCDGTVYASVPGDPFNFFVGNGFGPNDSYMLTIGGDGGFTGACAYKGSPTFFKEDSVCKIYGAMPYNYGLTVTQIPGISKSNAASAAISGNTVYYISSSGVVEYGGGSFRKISELLGTDAFYDAVGGSDGFRYYVSMRSNEGWGLFSYDTENGNWFREDSSQILFFGKTGGNLYMVTYDGRLMSCGKTDRSKLFYFGSGSGPVAEGVIPWECEFAGFYGGTPDTKAPVRVIFRFSLEKDKEASVSVSYDRKAYTTVGRVVGKGKECVTVVPIIPERAHVFSVKLAGEGDFCLYSETVEYFAGTMKG